MRLSSFVRRSGPLASVAMLVSFATAAHASDAAAAWKDAQQLVLVITPEWDGTQGTLARFERVEGQWKQLDVTHAITVGRNGAAWGIGLHPAQGDGPQKKEGDGRAPAGVFALGEAFGYAANVRTGLHYAPMQASSWCVDVPASPLYNRIVDSREVGDAAVAESTEPMRRDLHANGDVRYKEGFVIKHNPDNVPGAGSCIFAHLWKAPGETTAGCTAMAEPMMDELLHWLDARRAPVFVLLPQAEYARLRAQWTLPEVIEVVP